MSSFITAIGTATPENNFEQAQIGRFMIQALQLDEYNARKLQALYRSTKIKNRHSVLADYGRSENFDFYPNTPDLEPFPTVSQRMAAYQKHALPLVLKAVEDLEVGLISNIEHSSSNVERSMLNLELHQRIGLISDRTSVPVQRPTSNVQRPQITHLITVSCTGMYAPGLDIELVEALGLNYSTQRTAINFMGCYGAFNGLKVADSIVRANPEAKVLLVCVELCTLHFQKKNDDNNLLSNALFADGAAAVLIENQPRGLSLELRSFYCDLLPEGRADMAWYVSDFGFEMVLTSYVPKLVQGGIKQLVERLRAQSGVEMIDYYAIHPGGRAILEVIERELGLAREENRFSYDVLRDFGNMSSVTILFVLQRLLQSCTTNDAGKHILSCAFGPGLTLETGILRVVSE